MWIKKALEAGFTNAVELDCSTIEVRTEVRDMCAMNTCRQYGKNWACPPGCGTVEECKERIGKYKKGILVQLVGEVEDSLDIESMQEIKEKYSTIFIEFTEKMRNEFSELLPLAAGSCTICKECGCPDQPCRFPDKAISSMEAYGLLVNEICTANQIKYNYGPQKMAYTGCFLFE